MTAKDIFEKKLMMLSNKQKIAAFDMLMSCERVRVLGYAREGEEGTEGVIQHIGLELWKKFPENNDILSKESLLNFLLETPVLNRSEMKKNQENKICPT